MRVLHHNTLTPKPEARLTEENRLGTGWQKERANRLHRLFRRIEARQASGQSIRKSFKQFVWYWRGERYRSNRRIKVRFSVPTLYRYYRQWLTNGKTPKVILLRHRSGFQRAPQTLLLDFVDFCATPRSMSLLATWNEFVASRKLPPPVTYSAVLRYFDSARYRALQGEFRKIARATAAIPLLIAAAKGSIRAHYQKGQRV